MDKPIVAIFNTNDDLVEALSDIMEEAGYLTVKAHVTDFQKGRDDLLEFLRKHDPQVVVFDVPPPYADHWNFLNLVRSSHAMDGRGLVVTTTSKQHLQEAAGDVDAVEVVGKPFDLQQILDAVKAELERRQEATSSEAAPQR
jgi:DNA-binding response OmpR family regulator